MGTNVTLLNHCDSGSLNIMRILSLCAVSSVPMHNVHKMLRNRTMSMEDYDKPMKDRNYNSGLSESPPKTE